LPNQSQYKGKLMNLNELEKIVVGCAQGDRQAQEGLYKLFYSEMMAICNRYVNSEEEAIEVLHDGFMKIFSHLKKELQPNSLRAWMRRIMINTAIDNYRTNKKHYHGFDILNVHIEFDDRVLDLISSEEILLLVKKLPNSYRTVFNLHVIEGYTHPEIGEMLGISDGTSRSNFAKARQKLKNMLKTQYKITQNAYAG
jgi:RNA polymerase sigma factor (sigma-70 family)